MTPEQKSEAGSSVDTARKERKKKKSTRIKFGTFQGVFTPTILTILGVIMYVRTPWVVGNAGVIGAIGIITLATAITLFTTLSIASVVTNIRIKGGGAFSIIAQSLGLEAGGAIGIPLYIAQAFAVTLYVFGFREGWLWIFPEHPTILVDLGIFALIFIIANISTDFAFKTQYIILGIIILSLISVGMGFINNPVNTDIRLFGNYEGAPEDNFGGASFWIVFAVYFPAVTGIMAGVNMSGDLEDPRVNIPRGSLSAIGLSYLIYIALAVAIAFLATPQELLENYNILIDKSFFGPVVLAGLLGATFSSGLSSIVGAPRILQAMGQNNILFFNRRLAKRDKNGEPKFAFYFTCVIVLATLLLRDLNAIAPILTIFFLIAYAMINVVVLVEQFLGQISFRPTFKIPIIVPFLGAAGCFFVMFIVNSTMAFISLALVSGMYIFLTTRKNLETTMGDTRSGIFTSIAEWSSKMVARLPEASERAWQPNLLVPAQSVNDVVRSYKTIYNLARPKGSVKILGFDTAGEKYNLEKRLPGLCAHFMEQGISATYTLVSANSFIDGVSTAMQSLRASFFMPNTLFLSLTNNEKFGRDAITLLSNAKDYGFGAYLYVPYRKLGLGLEKSINLWLDVNDVDTDETYRVKHCNVGLLTAYLLKRNWSARMNIVSVLNGTEKTRAKLVMERLMILTRMPRDVQLHFVENDYTHSENDVPRADLNILVINPDEIGSIDFMHQAEILQASVLYTLDGEVENAMA